MYANTRLSASFECACSNNMHKKLRVPEFPKQLLAAEEEFAFDVHLLGFLGGGSKTGCGSATCDSAVGAGAWTAAIGESR